MGYSQSELVERFKQGKRSGRASSMYIDGDVMYSYGSHFPLLVRMHYGFVLNADKYSVTTSQHQSHCSGLATIQVPFSALAASRLISRDSYNYSIVSELNDIELVDKSEERWDLLGYRIYGEEDSRITVADYDALSEDDRLIYSPIQERRPESVVLRHGGKDYLSSMDDYNYFISQLPEKVKTVEEAFESLKPFEVRGMVEAKKPSGRGVQYTNVELGQFARQGEWFFTPAKEFPMVLFADVKAMRKAQTDTGKLQKWLYTQLEHDFVLPRMDSSSHSHIATRGAMWNEAIYISGSIRHEEHGMLRLSKADKPIIFRAYCNRAVNSWSASGRVD